MAASSDTFDQEFLGLGGRAELSVNSVSGHIAISASSGSLIRVHARKRGSPRAIAGTRIECERDGDTVSVTTRPDQAGLFNFTRNLAAIDYEIIVPEGCTVQVRTVSAEVTVRGTRGPVSVQTVSGDVRTDGVSGDCTMTTVSGDVVAERVAGALAIHTTSGDASVRHSRLERFRLNSVSGDFVIETPLARDQRYLAKTVSGDVRLLVPAATGATVQLKTVSGSVHTDLPADIIKANRRHWQGRINGGGAHVEVSSVSGDLRISSQEPGQAAAPAMSRDSSDTMLLGSTGQSTEAILSAVERGELTVEEALDRLEGVGA